MCMQRLVSGDMPDTASQSKRDSINKRVRRFRYSNGFLYRVFTDGSKREVPRPAERTDIVEKSSLWDKANHVTGRHRALVARDERADTAVRP